MSAILVYRSLAEVPENFGPTVAAIGNFDGLHCGHRAIVGGAVEEARRLGLTALAVTFNPHPEHLLHPAREPRIIAPIEDRIRLFATTGVDAVLVVPFDAKLAHMSPLAFARDILAARLRVRSLHEGHNFRFGHRAAAGVTELIEMGKQFGWTVTIHTFIRVHNMEVSSSAVRDLIAQGDVRRARWMLGRAFSICSTQVRGRGVGTRLLVPTINLAPYNGLLPAYGVYITRLHIAGRTFQAVTNVGDRPTFEGVGFGVETHILNFEPIETGDSAPLELEFLHRLRGEIAFPSPQALKDQILRDVVRAKRYFRLLALQR
jgi:riboflavin kinase/FMN adenylyltransferase